mgnify:FL=1
MLDVAKTIALTEKWREMQDERVKQEVRWVRRLIQVRHALGLPPIQTDCIQGRTRYRIGGGSCWATGLPEMVRKLESERRKVKK